ncbi:MAG: acyl carrier protein [Myxococcota bacterium]|jgi:acyl carrier protein
MTTQTLTTRLIALAAERFNKDATVLNASDDFFQTLGIDSLQALDLLTRLEEEFDVEIPDYELAEVSTFAALAGIIEQRI